MWRIFIAFILLPVLSHGNPLFKGHGLGLINRPLVNAEYLDLRQSIDLPTHFDWREKLGKQPSILDQGDCGSCWAFSRVMTLTWQYLIKGQAVFPAPQELVSCDREQSGCDGGFWDNYEVATGISDEKEFPYEASNLRCKSGLSHSHKITKWLYIGSNDRSPTNEEMKQAMIQYGPIGVTIAVVGDFPNGCDSGETNHMVVLTGWDDDKQSWFMQNSWGSDWENSGYANIGYGCYSVGETAAISLLP